MGDILSRESILNATVSERQVEIPEWGGSVTVRDLSKREQTNIRKRSRKGDEIDADTFEKLLFLACVVEPRFTEEDWPKLQDQSAKAIDAILQEIMGLLRVEVGEAKASFLPGTDESS